MKKLLSRTLYQDEAGSTPMISLEGLGVRAGFSGGPVLTESGKVVGVLIGGDAGALAYTKSWAVDIRAVLTSIEEGSCPSTSKALKDTTTWPRDGFTSRVYSESEAFLQVVDIGPLAGRAHESCSNTMFDQVIELAADEPTELVVGIRLRGTPGKVLMRGSLTRMHSSDEPLEDVVVRSSKVVTLDESWELQQFELSIEPREGARLPTLPLELSLSLVAADPGRATVTPIELCAQVQRTRRLVLQPSLYHAMRPEFGSEGQVFGFGARFWVGVELASTSVPLDWVVLGGPVFEAGSEVQRYSAPGYETLDLDRQLYLAVGLEGLVGAKHDFSKLSVMGALGPAFVFTSIDRGHVQARLRGISTLSLEVRPRRTMGFVVALLAGIERDPLEDRRYVLAPTPAPTVPAQTRPRMMLGASFGMNFRPRGKRARAARRQS